MEGRGDEMGCKDCVACCVVDWWADAACFWTGRFSLLELMKLSNLWLAPFQGLVTASLGAFFVSKK